jgi:exoribonuclease R
MESISKKEEIETSLEDMEIDGESIESVARDIEKAILTNLEFYRVCREVRIVSKKITLDTVEVKIDCDGERYNVIWGLKTEVWGTFEKVEPSLE